MGLSFLKVRMVSGRRKSAPGRKAVSGWYVIEEIEEDLSLTFNSATRGLDG
jgi:hypothetical protein